MLRTHCTSHQRARRRPRQRAEAVMESAHPDFRQELMDAARRSGIPVASD